MRNKTGQSILELTAVITLVTLGVFFAGPTIIRGINAHFKLWDDSIQDSYTDPMEKADPLVNAEMPFNCVCTDFLGGVGQNCGVSPCGPRFRLEYKQCSPTGCGQARGEVMEQCIEDNQCCEIYVDTPVCGLGTGGLNDCPFGDRVTQTMCGGNTVRFGCRPDPDPIAIDGNPDCLPKCLGTYQTVPVMDPDSPSYTPTIGVMCPGDDINLTRPPPWIVVGSQYGHNVSYPIGGCSNAADCQLYCPAPLRVHPTSLFGCVALWRQYRTAPQQVGCAGYPQTIWTGTSSQDCICHTWGSGKPRLTTIVCYLSNQDRTTVNNAGGHLISGSADVCAAIKVRNRAVTGAGCRNPGVPNSLCELTTW